VEKGCIEYHNKLLRQYLPKGTDFDTITDDMLKNYVTKLNRKPRKKMHYSTPVREFFKFFA
jgi:IS30 family transposase